MQVLPKARTKQAAHEQRQASGGRIAKNCSAQIPAWFQALRPLGDSDLQESLRRSAIGADFAWHESSCERDDATLPKIWTPCVAAGLAIENVGGFK
ncbi:hypothetical protein [Bradyrhizobium neotropicale]|uniref:hypothetical protein n=1 Tax=Bradyrhizobium neotropicale TaxID=1497615 RepID=UPI001AD64351|nr:hypothetical protein [Bradyrhizobium neotropicale]MBO4224284.1 hypothetical protein [Bradyrhizobium neotropicale]